MKPASESVSMPKVMVGLSGGVDSAVTALLLKQRGYSVTGLFMKNWDDDDGSEFCSTAEDLIQAAAVAAHLEIELKTVSFANAYRKRVFNIFLKGLARGTTPNPDVLCNREIKFDLFSNYAHKTGFNTIATGHYARTESDAAGSVRLLKGRDPVKDQSYFLHALESQQLKNVIFPLGDLHKKEVRKIARNAQLPNCNRRDSTGICFIGKRPLRPFLRRYIPQNSGDIITAEGQIVGRHKGLDCYTIGQRKGLGIGGLVQGEQEPWYVVDKIFSANQLLVAQGSHNPLLYSRYLHTAAPHWINAVPTLPLRCTAKLRHGREEQSCMIMPSELSEQGLRVEFDVPQRCVAAGQYAVFYKQQQCLGGAVITQMSSATEQVASSRSVQ